jgi:hypothetical protein
MTRLPASDSLARALVELLGPEAFSRPPAGEVFLTPLPSSRKVFRFHFPEGKSPVVGKFYSAYPAATPADRSLAREYENYLQAPALGLTNGAGMIPRLLGRRPEVCLGLLLAAVPGPDLDQLLGRACVHGDHTPLHHALDSLAQLLAGLHSPPNLPNPSSPPARPVPEAPVPSGPALAYLNKVTGQLAALGLLTREDRRGLEVERPAWEAALAEFPDSQVLVHGDATPTNFLFPNGKAVALDLERLRRGDRLWDLAWVAGELKHAWGWRAGDMSGAEGAIRHFFRAYVTALPQGAGLAPRVFRLNPFYMALAELRIARNSYLSWDYRRELVAEARRCLAAGRRP